MVCTFGAQIATKSLLEWYLDPLGLESGAEVWRQGDVELEPLIQALLGRMG